MIPLIEEHRSGLQALCRRYNVRCLELFGSAATDDAFDPATSDLDFLVDFDPEQDLGPWLKHYFEFQEELQRLFKRPVDLVMMSALKNERLIDNVNQTRQTLYAA